MWHLPCEGHFADWDHVAPVPYCIMTGPDFGGQAKPICLNPNPQRCNRTLAATAPVTQRPQGRTVRFCGLPPPTGRAMGNEPIEGDEWDAYVMLDTFNTNGTWDGLTLKQA